MENNKMTLTFSALSQNESFARSAVSCFALSLNPSVSEIADIKTAVSEAVTNSIVHGYEGLTGYVITLNNIKGYENSNYSGRLYVFTSENPIRCKIYFDTFKNGNYPISSGDVINGEFEYIMA